MDFRLYQSVVAWFPLRIGRLGPEYLILDFNLAVEHFLGWRIAELRGQLLGSALLGAVRNTITLSKTPTIQIVEGHRDLAYLPQQFLYDKEFEVLLAYDRCDGLDKFREYHPDLVILDVRMPCMDSMETCRRTRETSDVPIVVLTCTADEMDKVRGLMLGAEDYVTKPSSRHELVARVWAVLRRDDRLQAIADHPRRR